MGKATKRVKNRKTRKALPLGKQKNRSITMNGRRSSSQSCDNSNKNNSSNSNKNNAGKNKTVKGQDKSSGKKNNEIRVKHVETQTEDDCDYEKLKKRNAALSKNNDNLKRSLDDANSRIKELRELISILKSDEKQRHSPGKHGYNAGYNGQTRGSWSTRNYYRGGRGRSQAIWGKQDSWGWRGNWRGHNHPY